MIFCIQSMLLIDYSSRKLLLNKNIMHIVHKQKCISRMIKPSVDNCVFLEDKKSDKKFVSNKHFQINMDIK